MRRLLAESQKSLSHHNRPNPPPRMLLPGVHGPLPAMAKIKTARPTHIHTVKDTWGPQGAFENQQQGQCTHFLKAQNPSELAFTKRS